jgi:hypothetical protein
VVVVAADMDAGVGEKVRWDRDTRRGGRSGLELEEEVDIEVMSGCGWRAEGVCSSVSVVMVLIVEGCAPLLATSESSSTSTSSASRYHFLRLVHRPQPSWPRRPFCHFKQETRLAIFHLRVMRSKSGEHTLLS